MSAVISIAVFILGVILGVQVVASLYGPIDYSQIIRKAYPRVILKILIWVGLCAVLATIFGDRYRPAFLWGITVYIILYPCLFLLLKSIPRRNLRVLKRERQ